MSRSDTSMTHMKRSAEEPQQQWENKGKLSCNSTLILIFYCTTEYTLEGSARSRVLSFGITVRPVVRAGYPTHEGTAAWRLSLTCGGAYHAVRTPYIARNPRAGRPNGFVYSNWLKAIELYRAPRHAVYYYCSCPPRHLCGNLLPSWRYAVT